MGFVTWWIVGSLIFWLLTTSGLIVAAWLLLRWQQARSSTELEMQNRLFSTELENQKVLYERQLTEARASSQESLDSAREQMETTLQQQQTLVTEAIKQATFGTSSANQTLSDLVKRLIPILAAKDPIAAGQLSTLTDPAGGDRQELSGTPYNAEDDAALRSVDEAIAAATALAMEAGIDPDTARSSAISSVLLSRQ